MVVELPTFDLKTKRITFDERLQEVRILKKNARGMVGFGIESIPFNSRRGAIYIKKYIMRQRR